MSHIVQDIPAQHRFSPVDFDAHEKQVIIGALNKFGVENPCTATTSNLTAWTWAQVTDALRISRGQCIGDSLDDVTDVMFAVKAAEKAYVH